MEKCKEESGLSSIEVVNGYCNLFVNREKYVEIVMNTLKKDNSGVEKIGRSKTICVKNNVYYKKRTFQNCRFYSSGMS